MKSLKKVTLMCLIAVLSVVAVSCTQDKCKSVNCQHGGSCNSGICYCPAGYTGKSCETLLNNSFSGAYSGTDCGGTNAHYTIVADPENGDLVTLLVPVSSSCGTLVFYLNGYIDPVNTQSFVCTAQTFYDACGSPWRMDANCTVVGNFLTINFTIIYNGMTKTCVFNGSK